MLNKDNLMSHEWNQDMLITNSISINKAKKV